MAQRALRRGGAVPGADPVRPAHRRGRQLLAGRRGWNCELVAWSDQDDVWHPAKLERCARAVEDAGCDLVSHSALVVDHALRPLGGRCPDYGRDAVLGALEGDPWHVPSGFATVFRLRLLDGVAWEERPRSHQTNRPSTTTTPSRCGRSRAGAAAGWATPWRVTASTTRTCPAIPRLAGWPACASPWGWARPSSSSSPSGPAATASTSPACQGPTRGGRLLRRPGAPLRAAGGRLPGSRRRGAGAVARGVAAAAGLRPQARGRLRAPRPR